MGTKSKKTSKGATFKRIAQSTIDWVNDVRIIELVSALGYRLHGSGNVKILCPVHAEKTPSLNVNEKGNFFKCHGAGCNIGGNNAISFFMYHQWGKWDKSLFVEAVRGVCDVLHHPIEYEDGSSVVQPRKEIRTPQASANTKAGVQKPEITKHIKFACRGIIEYTDLVKEHESHLLHERKISPEAIRLREYRSFPEKPYVVAANIKQELSCLKDTPGFFEATSKLNKDATYTSLAGSPGILIPMRNEYLEVVGFQNRVDFPQWDAVVSTEKERHAALLTAEVDSKVLVVKISWAGKQINEVKIKKPVTIPVSSNGSKIGSVTVKPRNKYKWLSSSGLEHGRGAILHYHIAVPSKWLKNRTSPIGKKRCYITEGPLKGDIASEFMQAPFVCIPGVSNWRLGVAGAVALETDEVVIAIDADALMQKTKNRHTGEVTEDIGLAIEGMTRELVQLGKKVFLAAWKEEDGKGLDDLLINGSKPQEFLINK